eukprot:9474546-Pyramimonas_sp.AAC.1
MSRTVESVKRAADEHCGSVSIDHRRRAYPCFLYTITLTGAPALALLGLRSLEYSSERRARALRGAISEGLTGDHQLLSSGRPALKSFQTEKGEEIGQSWQHQASGTGSVCKETREYFGEQASQCWPSLCKVSWTASNCDGSRGVVQSTAAQP